MDKNGQIVRDFFVKYFEVHGENENIKGHLDEK